MYTMKLTSSYITLDQLRFYAYHGVDEQERRVGNEYQVDLVLKADIGEACRTDCLEGTVNYADVCQAVKQEMDIPSHLLEHVAHRVAQRIFDRFPQVEALELKLAKRTPPMGADIRSAGVVLRCSR